MATYGGGSLIQKLSIISTGNIATGYVGTIYTAPSDCEYVHLTFTAVEHVGGAVIIPYGQIEVQTQGVSNSNWFTQFSENLTSFGFLFAGSSSKVVLGGASGTLVETMKSGRVVSPNIVKNYTNTDSVNFTFQLFRGERILFTNVITGSTIYRLVMNEVAFKLSSAV